VLFTSTSGQGHFQPLAPLIRSFEDRGDEVLVIAPPSLVDTLEEEGFTYRLGGQPSTDDATRVWSLFPTLGRREAARLVEQEWFAGLCLDAMWPVVSETVSAWKPHLVVRETCEYAAALAADQASIPGVQVGISTAAAEANVLNSLVQSQLDRRVEDVTNRIFRTPYLTKFPASFDPSPYPATYRYRDHEDHAPQPLGHWWTNLDAPLIYLTLGTVAMRMGHGKEMLRVVLEAIKDVDARILVTTGHTVLPSEIGETPANVHIESWVDQSDVLATASLVICHGGSGTTFGALGAGVPLVLLPMFADQPTNARLVQAAGAGLAIGEGGLSADDNLRIVKENAGSLRLAVRDTLDNPRYREAAQAVAREINAAMSPRSLADRLATNALEKQ
jgi:UDP:flavonoid glycosyltransferase YjiC (YdhE family)